MCSITDKITKLDLDFAISTFFFHYAIYANILGLIVIFAIAPNFNCVVVDIVCSIMVNIIIFFCFVLT